MQRIDVVHEIGLTDEQLELIDQLVRHEEFKRLKEQFQTDPKVIRDVSEFIEREFEELVDVFMRNKSLILLLMTGNLISLNDQEEDHSSNNEESIESTDDTILTSQDHENIRNVYLEAHGSRFSRGSMFACLFNV